MKNFTKLLLMLLLIAGSWSLAFSQCTSNTSQYPGSSVVVNGDGNLTTISTCNYFTEYSVITGIVAGETYEFTATNSGYITIVDGNGTVLNHGVSPVTGVAMTGGDITVYWNLDASCATATGCETTTVQCTTCVAPPPPTYVAPWCEDFTAGIVGWTENNSAGDSWKHNSTPGYDMSSLVDHTTGAGLNFIWNDGSGTAEIMEITSPIIDASGLTTPMLCFQLGSDAQGSTGLLTDQAKIFVEATADGTTWIPVGHDVQANMEVAGGVAWIEFCYELTPALATATLQVRFTVDETTATSLSGFYNDKAIDDICINDGTCAAKLTATRTVDGIADCECTDLNARTFFYDDATGELILAMDKNNAVKAVPTMIYKGGAGDGTALLTAAAPYYGGDQRSVMDLYYDVDLQDPARQPVGNVGVLLPFSTTDYNDVNALLSGAGVPPLAAITDLYFYKMGTGDDPDPTVSSHGTCNSTSGTCSYIELVNGGASTATWNYHAGMAPGGWHYAEYEVATFSGGGGGGGGGAALPVELISFNAKAMEAENMITWETASEENTQWHIVERSANGQSNWEALGRLEAAGTSADRISYEYSDAKPLAVAYYRLRSVDFDAYEDISGVVRVERERVSGDVNVFPNPTKGTANVVFELAQSENVMLTLTDITGKVISYETVAAQRGSNTHQIEMAGLSHGIYFISMETSLGKTTERIVKN